MANENSRVVGWLRWKTSGCLGSGGDRGLGTLLMIRRVLGLLEIGLGGRHLPKTGAGGDVMSFGMC